MISAVVLESFARQKEERTNSALISEQLRSRGPYAGDSSAPQGDEMTPSHSQQRRQGSTALLALLALL